MAAASLEPARAPPRETTPWVIRAWASDGYRRTVPRWRERIEDQIERANEWLGPEFGLRFVLEEVGEWHRADDESTLAAILEELERHDPGAEHVGTVVAFVAASPSGLHRTLGMARLAGRHLVLRALDDAAELTAIHGGLDLVDEDRRLALYRQRIRHREVVVLVHEWAHTLGALHVRDDFDMLDPDYGTEADRFDPGNRRLLELGLAYRRGEIDEDRLREGWRSILADEGRWVAADRDEFVTRLQGGLRRVGPPADLRRSLEEAFAAARKGDLAARDRAAAAARAALEREGPSATTDGWYSLAVLYSEPPSPTLVEEAAGHAGEDPRIAEVLAWSARTRANVGLPPGAAAGVTPADEPAYIQAVTDIAARLARGDRAPARAALAAARKSWPEAPGLLALACERQLRDGRIAEARRACERALSKWEGCRPAHVLLGQLHLATRQPRRAVPHLRRAVELDPGDGTTQRALGEALRAAGDRPALEAHEAAYRARFGRSP